MYEVTGFLAHSEYIDGCPAGVLPPRGGTFHGHCAEGKLTAQADPRTAVRL